MFGGHSSEGLERLESYWYQKEVLPEMEYDP